MTETLDVKQRTKNLLYYYYCLGLSLVIKQSIYALEYVKLKTMLAN